MQGSLAGGAQAVLKDIDGRQDFSPVVQRGPGFVLEITENKCSMLKSKNIHFVSGDDVTKEFNESNVNNFLGDNANLCNTSDNIIVNACIDLGKPGAKTEPITTLELAARGECCDIIDEIIEIQQKEYAKVEPEKIKKDLDKFEEIIRGKGECEKAKQNISEDLKKYQKNPDQCKTIVEFKLIDVKFSTLNKLQDAQDLTANKSRQALAVDLAKDLKDYYPDYRKGYLERFSKNIVNDFAKNAKNIEIKKGFFSSLVSRFKDKVNGYKKNEEPENIKMIQGYLKNATSIILPKEPLNPNSKNNHISQEKTQGANLQAENISNKIRRNLEHLISKTRSSSITNKTSPDIVSTSSEFKKRSSSMNQK